MSFSARLADLVRKFRHAADDLSPANCDCSTGFSDLGAWVFTCARCFQAGLDAMRKEVGLDQPDLFDDPDEASRLEVDRISFASPDATGAPPDLS